MNKSLNLLTYSFVSGPLAFPWLILVLFDPYLLFSMLGKLAVLAQFPAVFFLAGFGGLLVSLKCALKVAG